MLDCNYLAKEGLIWHKTNQQHHELVSIALSVADYVKYIPTTD